MDLYIQENSNTEYTVLLKKITKCKISHKVIITLIPKALPLAKEPGSVSEPWLSVSQEELQGSSQCVWFKGKQSNSFFFRASTKAEIGKHSLEWHAGNRECREEERQGILGIFYKP